VNQTVDAAVQADEDTEVGDRLDGAGDLVAWLRLGGVTASRFGVPLSAAVTSAAAAAVA
jgi:hypothetical protein